MPAFCTRVPAVHARVCARYAQTLSVHCTCGSHALPSSAPPTFAPTSLVIPNGSRTGSEHWMSDMAPQHVLRSHSWPNRDYSSWTPPIQSYRFAEALARVVGQSPVLIVIDTLGRNAPGSDENSQRDMSKVVAACDYLMERFDCAVLLLHHTRRGDPEIRGSSVLTGAVDTRFWSRNAARMCCSRESSLICQPACFDLRVVPVRLGQSSIQPRPSTGS